jgi:UTP--glucose-1-phosphate uridylyltransferase
MVRKAVIPCAGLGRRWWPLARIIPKEMLPLLDKPVIHYVVEEAIASGIKEIIVVINEHKKSLISYFENRDIFTSSDPEKNSCFRKDVGQPHKFSSEPVKIVFIDQPLPLGLGHAILMCQEAIGSEPFAILLPDNIISSPLPCLRQLLAVYEKNGASVIAIEKVKEEEVSRCGLIRGEMIEPGTYLIQDMVEKPALNEAPSDLAIIGRYILTPAIFEFLARTEPGAENEIQLTDGLRQLLSVEKIFGYLYEGRRYDVGTKPGFLQATIEFALGQPEVGPSVRELIKTLSPKL